MRISLICFQILAYLVEKVPFYPCLTFSSTAEPSAQPDDSVDLAIRDISLRRLVLRLYFFRPEQNFGPNSVQ